MKEIFITLGALLISFGVAKIVYWIIKNGKKD
nr:MAG TPA: putative deoxyhypusine synthase [Caudoviricetes sp.]